MPTASPERRTHTRRDRALADRVRRRGDDCHICGQPIDYSLPPGLPGSFEADHIMPYALGGASTLDNLAASHRACNRAKSDTHPDTLAASKRQRDTTPTRCPDGPCDACGGTHNPPLSVTNPRGGVTFVTARRWTP
ncbi:HNH endonuclease [Mycobacteroides abscessus subsp. abscessus]|uniref:HNH endonuclease n=1 Tax=Mycobacteroides abscessus TaxID=36809 RepID=UPI0009287C1F|nr:HNH endonuclease signature motif containing protein [Mycobacteroides abscessus]SIA00097.1 HNH endonuclease [Mycobacteroides abscessus subsp. abscessus]SIA00132.1 HNH endonuclease [Mycobacteroides abscessus subsp. abscessus]